jgi:hypothetical protein
MVDDPVDDGMVREVLWASAYAVGIVKVQGAQIIHKELRIQKSEVLILSGIKLCFPLSNQFFRKRIYSVSCHAEAFGCLFKGARQSSGLGRG